uniref:PHD finger protein 10 n=1 Tax=Rhabditophanes sp. KR3021 TaxID=114890 RepID=A0AC35UC32_9BILA
MEDSNFSNLSETDNASLLITDSPLVEDSQDSFSLPALLNEEEKGIEPDEETNNSAESSQKPKTSRILNQDVTHVPIEPSQIIEYEWPFKSGSKYFIQEQIAELLEVTSFKRKYPNLSRRPVETAERNYLFDVLHIHNTLPTHLQHNLTAIRSAEVFHLMSSEYPEIWTAYQRAASEKTKQAYADQQKELLVLKGDSKNLEKARQKLMNSCQDFNKAIQNSRRNERKRTIDLQTGVIQMPRGFFRDPKKCINKVGQYPVALIPGQYTDGYAVWSDGDLKKLPLGTAVDTDYIFPVARCGSPTDNLDIKREDLDAYILKREKEEQIQIEKELGAQVNGKAGPCGDAISTCTMCQKKGYQTSMIQCTTCHDFYHIKCLGMPSKMINMVRNYEWSCMDCRNCTLCNKPDNEEKMLFCDLCDRGYHTFCVGFENTPEGSWYCGKFCVTDNKCQKCKADLVNKPLPKGRGRRPLNPPPIIDTAITGLCQECHVGVMTKKEGRDD